MTVIEGIVEHGDARGRALGFPTANLALNHSQIEDGVWVAQLWTGDGHWYVAAVSVGRRPTFYTGEGKRLLEAHLLDFNGDLYGQSIRVELKVKIRDQQSFPSSSALIAQLHRDVEITRAWGSIHSRSVQPSTKRNTLERVPA